MQMTQCIAVTLMRPVLLAHRS